MPNDNELPNLTETDITDLWRFRQEHKDSEDFHQQRRRAADGEILRRGAERDATVLATDAGEITITVPNTYQYDNAVVIGDFMRLIETANLMDEWRRWVKVTYRPDKRWLDRLVKRGPEWAEAIERMTIGGMGSPSLKGPLLADMGGDAPQEQEEKWVL